MFLSQTKIAPFFTFTVDLIILTSTYFITNYLVFGNVQSWGLENFSFFVAILAIWVIILLRFNLYEIPRIFYIDRLLIQNLNSLLCFALICAAVIFFVTDYKFSRWFLVVFLCLFSCAVLSWRIAFFYILRAKRIKYPDFRNIIVVGVNENVYKLIEEVLIKPEYQTKISAIFTESKTNRVLTNYNLGNLNETIQYLEQNRIDEIFVSLPHKYSDYINELLRYADNHMIRVSIIPEFSEYLYHSFVISYIHKIPIMKYRKEPLQSLTNRTLKRAVDLVISITAILAVFSWLFPLIALIIKWDSKGAVFFVQERTGKDGKSFKCLKFRSMAVNEKSDTLQATKNDARITKVGAFLRRTSLDELPQFINVLLNQMSIVGPRPHMLKHTEEYRVLVDKFMVRHFAKPGLTGWAQVLGYRGETKTVNDMENRAYADIWYIENWNFMLDFKIMFKTAYMMVFKKEENAY